MESEKKWYVIHTYSGYENKVKANLESRVHTMGMEDNIFNVIVPMEEEAEIKDGKKRNSQRKFFPNYVLVEMEMNDTTWHVVRSIPRVSGFVGGTAESPAPIPAHEVEAILRRIEEGIEKPRPKTLFEVGEEVRIIDGPFAEFMGTVEEVMYEKSRLKVSVLIFGRPTPVELEFHQVEKDL